ncbi:MAG: rhomboid family intramembrane serine protease [Nocardioides sp.]
MRDAAVGFHCPSCVAEGARETRQARTPYGGARSGNPALTSMVLVGTNVLVFLGILAVGGAGSTLVDRLALLIRGRCEAARGGFYPNIDSQQTCATAVAGDWIPGVADGALWQVLTSAFTHVEIWHIGFNMLALWFLGPQLELALGRLRFLALYLLSAVAGSTMVLWFESPFTQTLGASGAVFGLMGALLVLAVKVGGNVSQIGGWLAINAVLTFTFPNISWQGHLGGFLGGVLIAAVILYSPRQRRGTWQLVGLVSIAVLLLAAVAARVISFG